MVSIQENGKIRIYRRTPAGQNYILAVGTPSAWAPAGGAADANLANVSTPEKWSFVGPANAPNQILVNEDVIYVTFEGIATDGIDISDCIWNIPIRVSGVQGVRYLSRDSFANPAGVDVTATAAVEVTLGGYKITEGRVMFGGAGIYLDVQDDTA